MRIVVRKQNIRAVTRFAAIPKVVSSPKGKRELHRGVIDAGRKTKTKVQRAVNKQMGLLPGRYQSYVVNGTRGVPREANLSYEIFSVKSGIKAQNYKGLRSLTPGGKALKRMNASRSTFDQGMVRSAVWNRPRVFKRSFEFGGKFYMMRSVATGVKAPRILWTHDDRSWQPRSAGGQFASTGAKWGKLRQLYGPALSKELPEDQSLAAFYRHGPELLEKAVSKRIVKLMRY